MLVAKCVCVCGYLVMPCGLVFPQEFSQLLFRIIESCAPGPGVVGSRPEKFTLSSGQHVVGLVDREKMVGEEERWMCSFRASTGALVAAGVGKSVDEAFESMKSGTYVTGGPKLRHTHDGRDALISTPWIP